ncbi:hypothetical protein WA026_007096 [Henosepilachna vigintioctopunctata]|uniref:Tetraspanin n=1 Tax=Henosepilachna vigintioctopunctata TaxID=420089 RepID=A0AAW1V368_9CUCU
MSEELDVSMKCVQYMLFVSNFLFVMVSLLLISIGSVIKALYSDYDVFLSSTYFSPSDLLIISGFTIFFVAFFGCWGAIRESTLLVNIYGLSLIIILVLEVVAAVIATSMRYDMDGVIRTKMLDVFGDVDKRFAAEDIFNFTQFSLSCCGVNDQKDWKNTTAFSKAPPKSCCKSYNYFQPSYGITCGYGSDATYSTPCADSLIDVVSQTSYLVTIGAFCVCFIQVLGIVFARMLSSTIRALKTQRLVEAELRRQQIYSQIVLGATLHGHNDGKFHSTEASEA